MRRVVKPESMQAIPLPLPFGVGSVNCYLIRTSVSQVLIDTGARKARGQLLQALQAAGCRPGSLRLVILTHGDFDHIGNAAFLAAAFGARLAMHRDDAGMAERGDMFVNRKRPNALVRNLIPLFTGFREADRFTPDVPLDPESDLSQYGL